MSAKEPNDQPISTVPSNKANVSRRNFLKYVVIGGVVVAVGAVGGFELLGTGGGSKNGTTTLSGGILAGGNMNYSSGNGSSQSLDPANTVSAASYEVFYNSLDSLVRWSKQPGGPMEPGLATSWSASPDGTTWTFKLQQGVTWWNGDEFTSADVKFSAERTAQGASGKSFFPNLDHVDTPDKYTAVVVNKTPWAPMLESFGTPQGRIIHDMGPSYDYSNNLMGTGPFKLVSRVQNQSENFTRNPKYWEKDSNGNTYPYLGALTYLPTSDPSVREASLKSGQFLVINAVDPPTAKQLQSDSNYKVYVEPATWWYDLELTLTKPPFGAAAGESNFTSGRPLYLRQAIRYALDLNAILTTVLQGFGEVMDSLLPSWHPYYYKVTGYDYNPSTAKSLLQKAGYSNGISGITLESYTLSPYPDIMQLVKEQLQTVGIQIDIVSKDLATALNDYGTGAVEMFIPGNALKGDAALSMTPYPTWGCGYKTGMVPEYDTLVNQAYTTIDPTQRKQVLQQLQTYYMQQQWIVPMCYQSTIMASKAYVDGFNPTFPDFNNMKTTWLGSH